MKEFLTSSTVAVSRVAAPSSAGAVFSDRSIHEALTRLADARGWSLDSGQLSRVVFRNARVLVKPNLVLHQNEGTGGLACVVTNPGLIQAVVRACLDAGASEVIVGDAPIQGCDFELLLRNTGLKAWAEALKQAETRFGGIVDFRRTSCSVVGGVRFPSENLRPLDKFVLFDLGKDSLLEPVSRVDSRFRVAWYDPRMLSETHGGGFHRYLVAREVMDADVVINLPKLKTHKKAGITCALKNSIGINGNKEYLPHHRYGGSASGGDCYPGGSPLKRALEYVTDRQNLTNSPVSGIVWHGIGAVLSRTSHAMGDRFGVDGSWSGNDTIWRTCLDLNRILLYGKSDGTMADDPQRRVIHIVDAMIAGHGNGPLAPDPLMLGCLLGAENAIATDWVGAQLLAYEPNRIALLSNALGEYRWPLGQFSSDEIHADVSREEILSLSSGVVHPPGWRTASRDSDSVERAKNLDSQMQASSQWDA